MKKALVIVICIMLVLSFAIPSAAITGTAQQKVDTSKRVTLQFYMVGDAPKDLDLVMDKVNALALKDINATVKFNYTSWTDFITKYNLILSTGQPVDMIYTASWLSYQTLARKGAFMPLDALLPAIVPDIVKFVPADYWNQVKIGGKIYTIPATWKEYTTNGILYRQDLAEKYKLPTPDSIANLETYMAGVRKNMPGQILTLENVQPGVQRYNFTAFETLCAFQHKWVNGPIYGMAAPYATPSQMYNYFDSPEFLADMKIMKRWADIGFWSRSALSTKTDTTAFDNGKEIAILNGENAPKLAASITAAQTAHPDWKLGFVDYSSINGIAQVAHATQNGYGIPVAAQNPERALMFYEKLWLDKTYNQLTEFGIEGKHYTVKDGYYEPVGDATKSGFPREAMNGWAWRNENYQLYPKSYDVVKQIFAKMDAIAQKQPDYKGLNIFDGFAEDYTSYQAQRAALGTLFTQYLAPIEAGLVPDVKTAITTFLKKANAAGLAKVQAEYKKQWLTYCKAYDYK